MINIQSNLIGSSSSCCLRNVGSRVRVNFTNPISVGNVRCEVGSGFISVSDSNESSFKALELLKTSDESELFYFILMLKLLCVICYATRLYQFIAMLSCLWSNKENSVYICVFG